MINITLPAAEVDTGNVLTELSRFFTVAADSTQMCPMFSGYIDQARHALVSAPDSYADFSRKACGQVLRHQESQGVAGSRGSPTTGSASGSSPRYGSPMRPARSTRPLTHPTARPARFSILGTAPQPPTMTTTNQLSVRGTPNCDGGHPGHPHYGDSDVAPIRRLHHRPRDHRAGIQ